MFVTKKHMPRRTFLRGAGVTLALPLLESMVPALTPLRLTAAAPVAAVRRHLASARRGARLLEPAAGRQGLRVLVHHQAARAVPQPRRPDHRARHAGGDGDHRRAGRRSRARRRAAVRGAAAAQRRQPVSRHDHRSAHRQQVRPGHDPLVAAARRRRRRQLRQLQLGLQLRLYELDLLDVADRAAADRGEPARRVRAAVRRRHQRRGAAARPAAQRQHPRRRRRPARSVQARSGRRRQGARRHLRGQHPRDRAAHPDRDGERGQGAGPATCRSACRRASTSISA